MADVGELGDSVPEVRMHKQSAIDLWRAHGGTHWLPVTGHSMLPLLRTGDRVQVVPKPKYVLGDLVLFQQAGQLLVHRLVSHRRDISTDVSTMGKLGEPPIWITMGDNCDTADPPIATAQILGKVIALRRDGVVQMIDSWGWRLGNLLIARCMRTHWCYPLQRLILRMGSRYLRLALKGQA